MKPHRILRLLVPVILSSNSLIQSFSPIRGGSIGCGRSTATACGQSKRRRQNNPSTITRIDPIPILHANINWLHQHQSKRDDDGHEEIKDDITPDSFDLSEIDPLEIRLDATLLAIYVLCRFLFYDVSTGAKDTPGWELHDVIMILQTFSSVIALSGVWTLVGCATGIFRYDYDASTSDVVWKKPLLTTAIISGPIWISIEVAFGWPTAGVYYLESTGGNMGLLEGGTSFIVNQELILLLFTLMCSGTLGVGCIMVLGRYVRKYIV